MPYTSLSLSRLIFIRNIDLAFYLAIECTVHRFLLILCFDIRPMQHAHHGLDLLMKTIIMPIILIMIGT